MVPLFMTMVVVFKMNKLLLLISLPLWVNDGKQKKMKELQVYRFFDSEAFMCG